MIQTVLHNQALVGNTPSLVHRRPEEELAMYRTLLPSPAAGFAPRPYAVRGGGACRAGRWVPPDTPGASRHGPASQYDMSDGFLVPSAFGFQPFQFQFICLARTTSCEKQMSRKNYFLRETELCGVSEAQRIWDCEY